MTGSTLSSAVLAGALAAIVAIGGPGVVAVADPGSHSSQSRDGSQRNNSNDRRGDRGESRRDRDNDGQRSGQRDGRTGKREESRGSSTGRGWRDTDSRDTDSKGSGSKSTGSKSPVSNTTVSKGPVSNGTVSKGPAGDEPVFLVPEARPETTGQGSASVELVEPAIAVPEIQPAAEGGGGGGGVDVAAAAPPVDPPRVVFGNGRTPGSLAKPAETPPLGTAPIMGPTNEAPAPAAVSAPPLPAPPHDAVSTIVERMMTPPLAPVGPTSSLTSLWGLAGLLLAPLGGILLGYRQARANRAAAELKSSLSR